MKDNNIEKSKQQIEEHSDMCNIPDGIIKSMKSDIAEIKTALLGNKYQKKGLIERVEHVENELDKLEKLKWTISGMAMAISLIVSLAFRLIITFK